MFGHNNAPPSRGPPPGHLHHQPPINNPHGPPIVNQPPHSVVSHPVHQSGGPTSHLVGGERVIDWMEQIKKDYLTLEQDYLTCKHLKEELERKLESQIGDFQVMHNAIYDLENAFSASKQQ